MSELTALALPHIAKLHAYTPGLQPTDRGWTKLNTNECPYAPSPRVAEALRREIGEDGASLRLYPSPQSSPLRAAIASHHGEGLTAENVCVGNGSDDILNLLIRAFCTQEAAAGYTLPSYSLYPVLIEIQDGATQVIEFDRAMRLPLDRIAASTARAFFLTSPNAPTGVAFANADLERVLASFRGLLVVDEAYAPFATENAVPLLARYPNLVVVRTLSKAYALAGIRVGYALAHPEIIGLLDRVRALPLELSVGEQQRVGIARAVVSKPPLLVADEPTGNLDPVLSREVMALFGRFRDAGVTVVIATHDMALVRESGQREIRLAEGHLQGIGSPDVPTLTVPR